MQYALAATHEALEDAGWQPRTEHEREMTVSFFAGLTARTKAYPQRQQGICLGSGIGSFEEAYDTCIAYEKGVSSFIPTPSP